jgi:signal transduction histidine kinase
MASSSSAEQRIPFKIHPRVFAALGADLVTNDVVAIIELVKNSYDAFATTVDIRFEENKSAGGGNKIAEAQPNEKPNTDDRIEYAYLEILDNGTGMDRRILEEAWCVVATPYRQQHPYESKDKKVRRVAGEKGLGRLSAARLGSRLEMLTKAAGSPCWLVTVDWSGLAEKDDLEACYASCVRFTGTAPFNATGTRIRILDLSSEWQSDQIDDLRDNLARLVSPFSKVDDFNIRLHVPALGEQESPDILAPDFLSRPPYAIRGHVNPEGAVTARYEFKPIVKAKPRSTQIVLAWPDVRDASDASLKVKSLKTPGCGPFEFDIRAWDIGADDTQEIAEHFHIAKGNIRKAIRAHKGISLYRDDILVLPKSDDARDWLGLDLRRVSRVGDRLSTSQIVGYVSVSADKNKQIEDTSDREDLAQNSAVLAFKKLLIAIIEQLEKQRDGDRLKPGDKIKLKDLLEGVSADDLAEEVSSLADEGASVREVAQRVQDFNARLRIVREALKTRFVYYSRLATIGTIAQMLVHEIRNRTTAIGRFLRSARNAQLVACNR